MRPSARRELIAADPDFAFGHVLKGYFSMLPFNAGEPARRPRRARQGAQPVRRHDAARAGARRQRSATGSAGDIDATLRDLGADPRRASARRAGLPAAPLQRVLARPARPDGAPQADAALRHWSPELAGCATHARLPLLRARGDRQLRRCRGVGTRGHRARARRSVGRARRRPRAGDAGPARGGHRLAGRRSSPTGRAATT